MGGVATALRALGERVAAEGTGFLAEPAPEPGLGPKLLRLQAELRARLENPGTDPLRRELVELLVDVNVFLDVLERFDDSYTACIEITGDDVRYRLFCVDPARRMAEALARSSSTVLFSATLAPCGYFRSVLGLDAGALELTLPSPFPADNFGAIITGGVSTLYRRRQATKAEVARLLADFAGARAGNYIAYFPSYLYLGMVLDEFVKIVPDVRTIIQTVDLSEGERLAFLDQFGVGGGTMVAFALMGGVFGEAIDLPGERLSGAAIVGVGLPGLSPEREVIRRHYEEKEGRGFDYAFRYPGMNRVLQAAGRVVRTETDRGLVLLVDERFQMEQYRSLLPKEWNVAAVLGRRQLIERVTAFWGVDGTARP
jgi:Rad3-related DNA helicase